MKKHTEKQPIDDLFARKLGTASLRPSPDGFERLQARIKLNRPQARVVFWRDPTVQRYAALAACLLLVAGFGWLYWPKANDGQPSESSMAANRPAPAKPRSDQLLAPQTPTTTLPELIVAEAPVRDQQPIASPVTARNEQRLARIDRSTDNVTKKRSQELGDLANQTIATVAKPAADEPVQPASQLNSNTPNLPTPAKAAVASAPTRNAPAERVLVVTIAEPAALATVRQAAQAAVDEQPATAAAEKTQKETRVASLWQQVKRVKQGDVFARRTDNGDEGGLLSRAYNGLKQSFDKEKSAKQ